MQMIMDALDPKLLKIAAEAFAKEGSMLVGHDPEDRAKEVDDACRRNADAAAEQADRLAFANRKERRLAKALAR